MKLCRLIWLEAVTGPIHTKGDGITQSYEGQEEDWGGGQVRYLTSGLPATVVENSKGSLI